VFLLAATETSLKASIWFSSMQNNHQITFSAFRFERLGPTDLLHPSSLDTVRGVSRFIKIQPLSFSLSDLAFWCSFFLSISGRTFVSRLRGPWYPSISVKQLMSCTALNGRVLNVAALITDLVFCTALLNIMNALATQTESNFDEIDTVLTVTLATLTSTMKVKQNMTGDANDEIKEIIQKYICDTRRHFFKLSCSRTKAELRLNEWCPIRCRA
jgi:hypothetical protein